MKLWCVALLLAGAAQAEEPLETPPAESGQTWSFVGPRTVAPGENQVWAELGFPGLHVGYSRGVAPGLNVGLRTGFIFALEGTRELAPGVKVAATLKLRFFDAGRVSLGLTFEPGFMLVTSPLQGERPALSLPVGLRLGVAASSAIAIALQVEAPLWVEFGPFGGFNAPILSGAGVEYFFTSDLLLFAKARLGPMVRTNRPTEVVFDAGAGLSVRFK